MFDQPQDSYNFALDHQLDMRSSVANDKLIRISTMGENNERLNAVSWLIKSLSRFGNLNFRLRLRKTARQKS